MSTLLCCDTSFASIVMQRRTPMGFSMAGELHPYCLLCDVGAMPVACVLQGWCLPNIPMHNNDATLGCTAY